MQIRILSAALTVGALIAAGAPAEAGGYSIQTITLPSSVPAGDYIELGGLNDNGQLLVSATAPNVSYNFTDVDDLYNINTKTYAALPGAPYGTAGSTQAIGINDSGVIVGDYHPAGSEWGGYSYSLTTQAFSTVNVPGVPTTIPIDISNNGVVVGYYGDFNAQKGFIEVGGVFTPVIVPASLPNSGPYPTVSSLAFAINDSGAIVGGYGPSSTDTAPYSFLDVGGVFTALNMPGEVETNVSDINDAGVIVGEVTDGSGDTHGFIDKNGVYTLFDVPGGTNAYIVDINDKGQLAGGYTGANGATQIFVATPVPEPATWAMLLLGVGGLGLTARRARTQARAKATRRLLV